MFGGGGGDSESFAFDYRSMATDEAIAAGGLSGGLASRIFGPKVMNTGGLDPVKTIGLIIAVFALMKVLKKLQGKFNRK